MSGCGAEMVKGVLCLRHAVGCIWGHVAGAGSDVLCELCDVLLATAQVLTLCQGGRCGPFCRSGRLAEPCC